MMISFKSYFVLNEQSSSEISEDDIKDIANWYETNPNSPFKEINGPKDVDKRYPRSSAKRLTPFLPQIFVMTKTGKVYQIARQHDWLGHIAHIVNSLEQQYLKTYPHNPEMIFRKLGFDVVSFYEDGEYVFRGTPTPEQQRTIDLLVNIYKDSWANEEEAQRRHRETRYGNG